MMRISRVVKHGSVGEKISAFTDRHLSELKVLLVVTEAPKAKEH
jgi:hypothetical protein